jgi:Fe-S cluster assembly ATP-binding protein
MAKEFFEVKNLKVSTDGTELLHGVIFSLPAGSTTLLTGANGAGKSTLLKLIMGISPLKASGKILLNGKDITKLEPEERAKLGIFLSFQEPVAIPGLSVSEMLRSSTEALGHKMSYMDFKVQLYERIEQLGLDPFTAQRDINTSFSGGEKKKLEILQLLMLKPKLVLLDEIDSGLDTKANELISQILADYQAETGATFLIVSHNLRILKHLAPNQELVLEDGLVRTK